MLFLLCLSAVLIVSTMKLVLVLVCLQLTINVQKNVAWFFFCGTDSLWTNGMESGAFLWGSLKYFWLFLDVCLDWQVFCRFMTWEAVKNVWIRKSLISIWLWVKVFVLLILEFKPNFHFEKLRLNRPEIFQVSFP